MHKLSLGALLVAASLVFSGCSLLGTDDATTSPTGGAPAQEQVMPNPATDQGSAGTVMQDDIQELPVAQPDPAADQAGMQESQEDAPTGVPNQ